MLSNSALSGRFTLLFVFAKYFMILSILLRVVLCILQANDLSWDFLDLLRTLGTGFLFDMGTVTFIAFPGVLYFSLLPGKFIGSLFDRIVTTVFLVLTTFIVVFTFFAELAFWDEFKARFNFIAVDYLIYTHEVISNIGESYPIPLLLAGVLLGTALLLFLIVRGGTYFATFSGKPSYLQRAVVLFSGVLTALFFIVFIPDSEAEWSSNRYNSEISKSGIYSFFAAFRNNRMDYTSFYTSIPNADAFKIVKENLADRKSSFAKSDFSIHRNIIDSVPSTDNKNVVFILVESLSASFLTEFGNKDGITPFLDSLTNNSVFLSNLYATGTRTVRGMEAVTLCIPPTPGQSIVKRPANNDLYTISNVFRKRNYQCSFFYGGDGYFDNMNSFFGGNGFDIYDRGRGSLLNDKIKGVRHNITDREVTFENAWGICDEDILQKTLAIADEKFAAGKPFLNFVMTTSNHRPYSYPANKIDIPSGTSRKGAVKYTDFALKQFFQKAVHRPWYKNTIFIIVADHCASSAGKDEIDVANYHIPAFIVNLPKAENHRIDKQCSQIDLFPTVFGLLHWSYESDFFGKDIANDNFSERALIGTYRKLAMLKQDKLIVLSDQKKQASYSWKPSNNRLVAIPMDKRFLDETISFYQTADYLFSNKMLK